MACTKANVDYFSRDMNDNLKKFMRMRIQYILKSKIVL